MKGVQLPYPSLILTPSRWGGGSLTSRTSASRLSACHHGTFKLSKGSLSTGISLSQITIQSNRLYNLSRAAKNGWRAARPQALSRHRLSPDPS